MMTKETVQWFDCKYMLGLSATHNRRDGLEPLIYWYIGPMVYEVSRSNLIQGGDIIHVEPIIRKTNWEPSDAIIEQLGLATKVASDAYHGIKSDATREQLNEIKDLRARVINELIMDKRRNAMIISDVVSEAARGLCIVLTDRKVTRTSDQTELARLWQAVGPIDENRAARSVVPPGNSLVENARLFALLNMATCDALIASMDSKFAYGLWRPHHAIRLADTDDNPDTEADPGWSALILSPRFPEYISNHASLTGAFMHTLARLLGDEHGFTLSSPNYPNFAWTFERCSDAAVQAGEARIWAGIHYRHSCDVGQTDGRTIADHVLANFLLPLR